jgi:hypothetical protein
MREQAATAPSHGPGSSSEGRAPPGAVRVSRPRAWPSPHVPGLPAAPRTARVQSSPASRNPSAPIPLRGQRRSPRRAYSCTGACGPVEDIDVPLKWSRSTTSARFAPSAMSAATSISWRASSPIIRGPRRPPDGPTSDVEMHPRLDRLAAQRALSDAGMRCVGENTRRVALATPLMEGVRRWAVRHIAPYE